MCPSPRSLELSTLICRKGSGNKTSSRIIRITPCFSTINILPSGAIVMDVGLSPSATISRTKPAGICAFTTKACITTVIQIRKNFDMVSSENNLHLQGLKSIDFNGLAPHDHTYYINRPHIARDAGTIFSELNRHFDGQEFSSGIVYNTISSCSNIEINNFPGDFHYCEDSK